MTLLKRKRLLAAKIEATPGTAETLAAADAAFNVYDLAYQIEVEVSPREGQGSFDHLAGVPAARKVNISFKIDLGWDGTATEPAWADTFLPACGLVKATNTFTPRSEVPGTNVKTLTMAVYEDGRRRLARGCVGNMKLIGETGKMAVAEYEFTGIYDSTTDTALLAPTYPTVAPLRYASGVTTYNSVALQCQSVTLDMGNEIILREGTTAGNVSGFIAGAITNRRPTIVCNPESKLVGTQDRYGIFFAGTQAACVFEIAGPTTSKIVVTAPAASIDALQDGERNMLLTDELTFLCGKNGSTSDSDLTIVFTP